jgi:hypothetical protein
MFLAAASAGSRSDHRIAVKQTIAMGTISLLFIDRLLRALRLIVPKKKRVLCCFKEIVHVRNCGSTLPPKVSMNSRWFTPT